MDLVKSSVSNKRNVNALIEQIDNKFHRSTGQISLYCEYLFWIRVLIRCENATDCLTPILLSNRNDNNNNTWQNRGYCSYAYKYIEI